MIRNIFKIQYIVHMLWCISFNIFKRFYYFYILNDFLRIY
jgi:hypothetical protein